MGVVGSEWLKTKRTPIRYLIVLMPVIFTALIVWYYSMRTIKGDLQISIFEVFFMVWTAMIIPLGVGLISGLSIYWEELAGGFNGLLGAKLPRLNLYLGKLMVLALSVSASTLLAVLTLVAGLRFILKIAVSTPIFIAAAIMGVIGTLPLLAFHLWVSLAWGMGVSIGIGGAGLLIAALMGTSLGDRIWPFVPWAWPVRLSMLPSAYLLYQPGMEDPPVIISSGFIINQTIKGLIPAAIFFLIMLVCGIIWFKGWEGRKVYE